MIRTGFDAFENINRIKLALVIASALYKRENVLAVGLCGSVVRGETTQTSDIDLIVVRTQARLSKKIVTYVRKGITIQVSFLTTEFIEKFTTKSRANDWFEYRLITRLRESIFLFTKDPIWTIRIIRKLRKARPTAGLLKLLLSRAHRYLSDGSRYEGLRNTELALVAFRGALECMRRLVFARTLEEFGGHKWGLTRLKLSDAALYTNYIDAFAARNGDPRESALCLRRLLQAIDRQPARFRKVTRRDRDIMRDILGDARDMISINRLSEASVILAQVSLVMFLPTFSPLISFSENPTLTETIMCACMLDKANLSEIRRISRRAKNSYKLLNESSKELPPDYGPSHHPADGN